MTTGEKVITFIERYCVVPEGALVGQPIKLADFQKKFILDVFDNPHETQTAILSMARKNAKSATIACLVLAALVGPIAEPNSQVISGANSRDQAALIFNLVSKMISLSEPLSKACHVAKSHKTVTGLRDNVEYKAISAEATTAHGLSPRLAILDEIGQVVGPTSPFIEAVTTSMGAHSSPLLVMISTQAPSDQDYLSIVIDDAVRSEDPHTICHLYAADNDCDLLDEEQWVKANPALDLFRSRKDLERSLQKASRLPQLESSSRNLLLNQRISREALWLAPSVYKLNSGEPDLEVFRGNTVAIGLDLSARQDLTAAVFAARDHDGVVHTLTFCFTPSEGLEARAHRDRVPYDVWARQGHLIPVAGSSVDYSQVVEFLHTWMIEHEIDANYICFDRWRIKDFRAAADEYGFASWAEWKEVGQGYRDISPRCDSTLAAMLEGKIRHGDHPVLTMAAASAIAVQDPSGNTKLDKSKASNRIDPLIALIMAVHEVTESEQDGAIDVGAMIG